METQLYYRDKSMETQLYYHDVPFRPMSTAPTDGKTIMLARKSLSPAAKWMADIGCYESGTRPYWSSRLGLYASECRSNPPLGWLPLTAAERDSGDCRSCLGELCTAGPDCVATSNTEPVHDSLDLDRLAYVFAREASDSPRGLMKDTEHKDVVRALRVVLAEIRRPARPLADIVRDIVSEVYDNNLEVNEAAAALIDLISPQGNEARFLRLLDRLGFGLAGDKELGRINVSVKTKPGTATYLYTAQELINELEKDRA